MTTPNLPWSSTSPSDLPQNVVAPSQLGSALQDQSAGKFKSEAASRFPAIVNGTSAGNPANVGGPLGLIVQLFANFAENVATADPADIKKPDDLLPLVSPFFKGLPLEQIPGIGDLIELLTGVEDGDLDDLGTWVNTVLRPGIQGLIDMARIPQLSLSQLTNQPGPNMLSGFGDFASEDTMDGGGDWTWDAAVGGGSARATLSGARKVLTSELVPVSAGQVLAVAGKARRQSAVGSGQVARLVVMPFVGDVAQAEVVIGGVGSGTDMSGTVVSQSWTVPASVTGVRVRITVEAAGTSGTVWWDDVSLRKTATSLPQQWIGGLVDALGDLGDDIGDALAKLKEFIEKLTGQARSSVQDAINDVVTFANQVKTLLTGGTVSSPLPNLVSAIELGQNQIVGLVGSLAEKATTTMVGSVQNFILNLANAILSAIRKVPVAGGVVADRIQEVLDEMSGLKDQADGTKAGIVQGWSGGSTAGADTDVYDTLAQVKSFAEGGYTVETKTSSGSWTVPANLKELIVIGIGGGGGGNKGFYAYQQASGTFVQGGAGGYGGSYLGTQIDLNVLPAAGGTVSYTVGAGGAGNGGVGGDASATAIRNGGTTSFGSWMSVNCNTGKQIATLLGYQATTSGPGSGGQGGDATAGTSASDGQNGVSTQQAVGGDGGVAQFGGSSGNAANGGNGGNASPAAATKTGGAGGGGGGARHVNTLATSGNGGDGGNGGYPGGGAGGGGACYRTNTSAGGSAGNGGVGAAGILWIMWR